MSKSSLFPPNDELETQIIEALIAGHKQWRPDLGYPQSHSDMQGAVRNLLRMFEVKRRTTPYLLRYPCVPCDGAGQFRKSDSEVETCKNCRGRGWVEEDLRQR